MPRLRRGGNPYARYIGADRAEIIALINLYNATGGASWTNKTNWLVAEDVDDWYGVTCAGGHVTQLNLSSNNLVGTFPAMTNLPYLTKLELQTNASLAGNVENLPTSLTYLNLSDTNSPSGSIAALTSLTYVRVAGSNTVSGSIAALTSLSFLDVSGSNTVSGSIAALTSLTTLSLTGSNTVSGSIAALTSLNFLYVSGSNTVSGSIAALTSLTFLYVSGSNTVDWTTVGGCVAIRNLYPCKAGGLSTAEVDACIDAIWTARNDYTYAGNILLNISGYTGNANGAPTGTVQDVCGPTTPAEKLYNLHNVQCGGDTHNVWSPIVYTGGSL